MATLDDDDTDSEEKELAHTREEIMMNITEEPAQTRKDDNGRIFSHLAYMDKDNCSASFISKLQENTAIHTMTKEPYIQEGRSFDVVMIKTGASRGGACCVDEYSAYCRARQKVELDSTRVAKCDFGIGSSRSIGVAKTDFPIENDWFSFHPNVVEADVPTLLSIDDMDRTGAYMNNMKNKLIHPARNRQADVIRRKGHPYLQWNEQVQCFFTYAELHRLHPGSGNRNVDRLCNLLQKSDLSGVTPETHQILHNIEIPCVPYQTYAKKLRRFKFTQRNDVDFDNSVYVDIFYISGKRIPHVVHEAIRHRAARWLLADTNDGNPTPRHDTTSKSLWRALRFRWINVYLDPPDINVHNAGNYFLSHAFQASSDMLRISTKSVPVEPAHSMSFLDLYHDWLRRAFFIIKKEARTAIVTEVLRMAVKAVNDSVGPD